MADHIAETFSGSLQSAILGGLPGVASYLMRGLGTVSGDRVYWAASGAPDWAGVGAPEAVTDVAVMRRRGA